MNLAIISFTKAGSTLNNKIKGLLVQTNTCQGYYKGRCEEGLLLEEVKDSMREWCSEQFDKVDGMIFIGACGIAVRTIAPFVKDKTKDPFVLVIDERASFVISLLSGHIGGGNELTLDLSKRLNAVPVITTATDINQAFAVDVFAKKEELYIGDMKLAKEVSAAILEGKKIGLVSDIDIVGEIPKELVYQKEEQRQELGIYISSKEGKLPFSKTLHLIPKTVVMGVGCRKDTDVAQFEAFLLETLKEQQISLHAIKQIASIDLKAEETCIKEFTQKYNIKFVTYLAEELKEVKGEFEESEFVKKVTGVGNVCERSAIKACKNATVFMHKKAYKGMTIALAMETQRGGIRFE